ncbi:zinc finger protein 624-like [Wyeomyia smithii]|uniref:zinc finger protein 624-like n=1 Tax=Wyeomyia smithii TaxID=174621 RepID=UPI002467CE12|nr:zinc finger protein 624-like [Wyeomyia smithii]
MKDAEDLELQVNANEMCRACLGQFTSNQLKPIFCNEILDGKIVAFPRIIEDAIDVKPVKNGIFPNNVCVTCKTKLKEMFSFKEKVTKSQELLYEIFGIDKPAPPATPQQSPSNIPKKEKINSLVQTDVIRFSEADEHIYSSFLFIEKLAKPKLIDCFTQNVPLVKDSFTQFIPELVKKRHVSTQVSQPKKNVQHSGVQVDIPTKEICNRSKSVDNELHDITDMDLMYEIEDNATDSETGNNDAEDKVLKAVVITKNLEGAICSEIDPNENQFITVTASKPDELGNVKLELELASDNEPDECVAYEALDEVNIDTPVTAILSETNKKSKYQCGYCQYVTDVRALHDSHNAIHQQSLETVLDSVDYYRCMTCKCVYATLMQLENHFEGLRCSPISTKDFIESDETEKHEQAYSELDICLPRLKTFFKNDQSQIICEKCSLSFNSLSDAAEHHTVTHDYEDESRLEASILWESNGYNHVHVCGICNDQFADARFIRQHIYFHQSRFDCPFDCGQSFSDFFKMTVHINRKHLQEKSTNNETPSSVKTAKTVPQSESVCHICFKRFISKASFKVHVKNHFAERRYNCSMCPKAFLQKSDLTIHIRSHTDERPFSCTVAGCDKKFRTSSHRRDHMSTHAQEKKYQCDVCQKYFKAERILQGHLRLHSGVKPFECGLCGKCFSRKHHLKLHMQTHDSSNE